MLFGGRIRFGKESEESEQLCTCQAPSATAAFDPYPPKSMLKAGIVGLPNVGKSTLFNALTRSRKAEAANYPFCTIDPNVGVVTVPDDRLEALAKLSHSQKVVPTAIEFVDIAGLV